jgi:hypothetical protein
MRGLIVRPDRNSLVARLSAVFARWVMACAQANVHANARPDIGLWPRCLQVKTVPAGVRVGDDEDDLMKDVNGTRRD